jgi:hypothetical protein
MNKSVMTSVAALLFVLLGISLGYACEPPKQSRSRAHVLMPTLATDSSSDASDDACSMTAESISTTGSPHGTPAARFITVMFENLAQDVARGEGEYAVSAARLLGVPAEKSEAFVLAAQENFSVTSAASPEKLMEYLQGLVGR